ncbi:hypothetical protein [Microvirga sp. VF16]|uniref:hypothetical protein n=1 Tax=Microvirga sp. VF16 TaxID=2807101 RepID=UPI00193E2B49|nr:hypothetical protein [Microvirga sp. VF16]QRM33062.1 hypothetical protein JO965_27505 [Microvirga sp. VF16]
MAVTGLRREHVMRVLRQGLPNKAHRVQPNPRIYDNAVREALVVIWEASDPICGKRLEVLVPVLLKAMERHGHLRLVPEVRERFLGMSAVTIDEPYKRSSSRLPLTGPSAGQRPLSGAAQHSGANVRQLG